MGMFITAELLRQRGACSPSVRQFRQAFPNGVEVSVELAQAEAANWPWTDAVAYLLESDERDRARELAHQLRHDVATERDAARRARDAVIQAARDEHAEELREAERLAVEASDLRRRLVVRADTRHQELRHEAQVEYEEARDEARRKYDQAVAAAQARRRVLNDGADQLHRELKAVATDESQRLYDQRREQFGTVLDAVEATIVEATVTYDRVRGELNKAEVSAWATAFGEVAAAVTDRCQPPSAPSAPEPTVKDGGERPAEPAEVKAPTGEATAGE